MKPRGQITEPLLSEVTGVVPRNWRHSTLAKVKTGVQGIQHSGEIITWKARNLDTRCLSVVSFKPLPVTSGIRAPGGCLGPNASLPDAVQKVNFLHLPGIESQFFGRPARNLVGMLTYPISHYLFSVYLMASSIARILKRYEETVW